MKSLLFRSPFLMAAALLSLLPLLGPLGGCTRLLTAPSSSVPPTRADLTSHDLQMALGNPDNAQPSPSSNLHYLMRRPQLALSYNDRWRFPNWVAWHLSKSDIGTVERGQFQPDDTLPKGLTRVLPSDYTGSGYDRGHNCPSKDRTSTRKDNDAVFLMTNMTPQTHGMNAGPWEGLESYSRDLTSQGDELFITAGHGFTSGPDDKTYKTIGPSKVAVPNFGWKIVVVVPPGTGSAISRITPSTRVIAVRMPNISTVSNKDWREFRTSVADIETATGLTFFDKLPKATADALKERIDFDRSAPSKQSTTADPPGSATGEAAPASSDMVWVNTSSGVYWKPGTRYYGKTKQGKYMSEADAIKAGYHAAKEQ